MVFIVYCHFHYCFYWNFNYCSSNKNIVIPLLYCFHWNLLYMDNRRFVFMERGYLKQGFLESTKKQALVKKLEMKRII